MHVPVYKGYTYRQEYTTGFSNMNLAFTISNWFSIPMLSIIKSVVKTSL